MLLSYFFANKMYPFIQIKKLKKSEEIWQRYSFQGKTTDYLQIYLNVSEPDTTFIHRLKKEKLTELMSKASVGKFQIQDYVVNNWFLGNRLSYSISCPKETAIESKIESQSNIAPRLFNLMAEKNMTNTTFYYSMLSVIINKSFITVIQNRSGIYVNECRQNLSFKIRCYTKQFINSTELILESVLTTKLFAFKNKSGYHVLYFPKKGYTDNVVNISEDISTCSNFNDPSTLICSDGMTKNTKILNMKVSNNSLYYSKKTIVKGLYVKQLINSKRYENIIIIADDGKVVIFDILKNFQVAVIQSQLTETNDFYIYLVKDYLVIICYSRNSFEEYYLGVLDTPTLVKNEFFLDFYNYQVLKVSSLQHNREWTYLMPILVVESNKWVNLVFFEIGRPYFTTIKSVHELYEYRPFSRHHFQFTSKQNSNINSNERHDEVISFIDAGSNEKKCGGSYDSGILIACDLIIYHNQKILINTTKAEQKVATCSFNVSSITSFSEKKEEIQFPFTITTGDERQVIKAEDKNLDETNDVQINTSSTEIYLNDKFHGPVLLYAYNDREIEQKTKVDFKKAFEPITVTHQILKLTREQLEIQDTVLGNGGNIFLLGRESIIQLAHHNLGAVTKTQPNIKSVLRLSNKYTGRLFCNKLIFDNINEFSFTLCDSNQGMKIFVSSWYTMKPKSLTEEQIRYKQYSVTKNTFYINKELYVWSVEKISRFTNVQSYLFHNYEDIKFGYTNEVKPTLSSLIPESFKVSESPANFIEMVKIDNFSYFYKIKKDIYEKTIINKKTVELEIRETVENIFVLLFGSDKDNSSQDVSDSHDFNPVIKILAIVSEGNTDILQYEVENLGEKTGTTRARELMEKRSFVVHELLKVYLFDYIDPIYQNSFSKIMNMKCEKTAVTNKLVVEEDDLEYNFDMNEKEYYFSCVLTQKKNFHLDLFFTLKSNQKLEGKTDKWDGLDNASLGNIEGYDGKRMGIHGGWCNCPDGRRYMVGDNNDNCKSLACTNGKPGTCSKLSEQAFAQKKVTCATSYMKITNIYINYGDFETIGPLEISSKQVAIAAKRKTFIKSSEYARMDKDSAMLPDTYILMYNRTDYNADMLQSISDFDETYREQNYIKPEQIYPSKDHNLLEKFKMYLVHEKFFQQTQKKYRIINGGVPVIGDKDSMENTKIFFEQIHGKNYIAYTTNSYYPLSIFMLRDYSSLKVNKGLSNKDITVVAYNHYSNVIMTMELKDNLFNLVLLMGSGFIVITLAVVCLTYFCLRKRNKKYFKSKRVKRIEKQAILDKLDGGLEDALDTDINNKTSTLALDFTPSEFDKPGSELDESFDYPSFSVDSFIFEIDDCNFIEGDERPTIKDQKITKENEKNTVSPGSKNQRLAEVINKKVISNLKSSFKRDRIQTVSEKKNHVAFNINERNTFEIKLDKTENTEYQDSKKEAQKQPQDNIEKSKVLVDSKFLSKDTQEFTEKL